MKQLIIAEKAGIAQNIAAALKGSGRKEALLLRGVSPQGRKAKEKK